MHILDIHNELTAHYSGCYGVDNNGKVVYIQEILQPECSGHDDYGEKVWEDHPNDLDVHEAIDFFDTYVQVYDNYDMYSNTSRGVRDTDMRLSDINFVFPEEKLVQFSVRLDDEGNNLDIVKHISRHSVRQYRRGLRKDYLDVSMINFWLFEEITQYIDRRDYALDEILRLNTGDIIKYIQPEHCLYSDVLEKLGAGVGTYSVSDDWWIGQGRDGLIAGWKAYSVGTVNDVNGKIKLSNNMGFLVDGLNETLGDIIE